MLDPSRLIRKMLANFFAVEFQRTLSKLMKRKTKLLSCGPVLNKKLNVKEALSCHSRAVTAKKCTKTRDARAKLLFANLNLFPFCRSRC